jgi:16S rRNA (cytosine1402-N4)-methyltransferase
MLIGTDKDAEAITRARRVLSEMPCTSKLYEAGFEEIKSVVAKAGVARVSGIVLDLGLSSFLIASASRGFSFNTNGPLDMRFSQKGTVTAADIVNSWSEANLADLFHTLGEERFARRIAAAIVTARKQKHILSTGQLADIIESAIPSKAKKGRTHPATKSFQALRMAVNSELTVLNKVLADGWDVLASGGVYAIISFHSLEDRIVKQFFKEMERNKQGVLLVKKPTIPTPLEIKENPRARSAKLRIIQKL